MLCGPRKSQPPPSSFAGNTPAADPELACPEWPPAGQRFPSHRIFHLSMDIPQNQCHGTAWSAVLTHRLAGAAADTEPQPQQHREALREAAEELDLPVLGQEHSRSEPMSAEGLMKAGRASVSPATNSIILITTCFSQQENGFGKGQNNKHQTLWAKNIHLCGHRAHKCDYFH